MAKRIRIDFSNTAGERLAAALELPVRRTPKAYVLFAHCFTCGKDIRAASYIGRALADNGYAVLRFDFTGLGGSEGDFANTNFSSNVEDLVAAATFLRNEYQAPQILVGHSLGGTAVVVAAERIPEVQAVVTIAAPANPDHLLRNLDLKGDSGDTVVQIAGRDFTIKQQFIEDLRQIPATERLKRLDRALLVLHAPLDKVVSIDEASRLFQAARHPKSFVSLDGTDHLLSGLADAHYVADTISAWAGRYVSERPAESTEVNQGEVLVEEGNRKFLRLVSTDDHTWTADEPKKVGGDDLGPDPYEHLLAALGTCTSMTIRLYANRKKWPLEDIDLWLTHSREHMKDCEDCEESESRVDVIRRRVALTGNLSEDQRKRLLEIADRCPVHRTLEGDIDIRTTFSDEQE